MKSASHVQNCRHYTHLPDFRTKINTCTNTGALINEIVGVMMFLLTSYSFFHLLQFIGTYKLEDVTDERTMELIIFSVATADITGWWLISSVFVYASWWPWYNKLTLNIAWWTAPADGFQSCDWIKHLVRCIRDISPKSENSVIIYLTSCRSNALWLDTKYHILKGVG